MPAITGDQLRGHLDMMILSTLEQGEAHGLAILQQLEAAGCGLLKLKEGSLYPALYRLESSGLVTSSEQPVPIGQRGARRRVYRLTRRGRGRLIEGRQEWWEFATVLGKILGVPASCPIPLPAN